ncbi:uncharacterized protein MELLADRAFT_87978 [Melampsora larici-populina 98AG31]|uniref:Wax synthase domain-containing protein n=1 Tax=Melampsora larici-populina (strain 98AG31 / pathotype 3-4-7) TaxID=747676 RepID=F4RQL5_MELLP|nr:uncharacterized protein MELLADRAFT_87978 [Melampsora larici-populina 98AG31]EGG05320.1 hypothetical protein MELLADRAFT_87978 [Melampsora larici-populina 98AG31]
MNEFKKFSIDQNLIIFFITQIPIFFQTLFLHPIYFFKTNFLRKFILFPLHLLLLTYFLFNFKRSLPIKDLPIALHLIIFCLRSLIFSRVNQPYYQLNHKTGLKVNHDNDSFFKRIQFALSLLVSLRGIGWSHGIPKPKPTDTYYKDTIKRILISVSILLFSSISFTFIEHFKLSRYFLTIIIGLSSWSQLELTGSFLRFISYSNFFFDFPIYSKTLNQFWSKRWHSLLKEIFIKLSFYQHFESRWISLIWSFTLSGLIHEFSMWFASGQFDPYLRTTLFFISQGFGILLERKFNLNGTLWTFFWLTFWGRFMVDAWLERDLVDRRPIEYLDQLFFRLILEQHTALVSFFAFDILRPLIIRHGREGIA